MYTTINFSDFCDAFNRFADRKDTFSYQGKRALFDYLTQCEDETGESIELDVVALCCEWTEYDSAIEAASEYSAFEGMTFDDEGNEAESLDEVDSKAIKFLEDNTTLLKLSTGGVIIQQF